MKPSKGIRIPTTVEIAGLEEERTKKRREAVRRVSTRAQVREEREDEDGRTAKRNRRRKDSDRGPGQLVVQEWDFEVEERGRRRIK